MTRFTLLSLSLASLAACVVGNVPDDDTPPGVVCDKKAQAVTGKHYEGMTCGVGGDCHPTTAAGTGKGPFLLLSGTVYEKNDGVTLIEGSTVTVSWTGGSKKYVSGSAPGKGNVFDYDIAGITFPATVKVSMCPNPEKVMNTPIASAADLNCSRSGCHDANLRIYIK